MDINSPVARRLKASRFGRPIGIAAYRLHARLTSRGDLPRLLVNSMPKSGTHLAMSLLDAVPGLTFSGRHCTISELDLHGAALDTRLDDLRAQIRAVRRSQYLTAHFAYAPRIAETIAESPVRAIHVKRDPRAVTVSLANYLRKNSRHPLHPTVMERFPDQDSLLTGVIEGFESLSDDRRCVSMAERIVGFAPWLDEPDALVLRFEDLVGARGGGSDEAQLVAVEQILALLGVDADRHARDVAAAVFDTKSATFNTGEIDAWRRALSPAHLQRLKETCGDLAEGLGYPL